MKPFFKPIKVAPIVAENGIFLILKTLSLGGINLFWKKEVRDDKKITNMQIKIEGLQGQVNVLTNNQKKIISLISKIEQVIEEWKEKL